MQINKLFLFKSSSRYSFDKLLLEYQENQYSRQRQKQGARHNLVPELVVLMVEGVEAHRQGVHLLAGSEQAGP